MAKMSCYSCLFSLGLRVLSRCLSSSGGKVFVCMGSFLLFGVFTSLGFGLGCMSRSCFWVFSQFGSCQS